MTQQADKALQAYLERVIALREARAQALSEGDLREIAREVGLSDEDLLAADQAAEGHYQRGENYFKHGRLDDAIRELQDAIALAPGWLQYKALLAQAFARRWQASGREPDRHAAASLARECIAIDPDHADSYQLLNMLDRPQASQRPSPFGAAPVGASPAKASAGAGGLAMIGVIAVALMGVVCTGGLGMWLVMARAPAPAPAPVMEIPEQAAPIEQLYAPPAPVVPQAPEVPSTSSSVAPSRDGTAIPTTLELGSMGELVALRGEPDSVLKVYSASSGEGFYTLNLRLENISAEKTISRPKVKVTLLDAQDQPVASLEAHTMSFAPDEFRPKDMIPLRIIRKVPSTVTHAKLEVLPPKLGEAAAKYEASKLLEPAWAVPAQRVDEVTIFERSARFKVYSTNKADGYFVPELELHNGAAQEIEELKFNVLMYDKQDQLILSEPLTVTSRSSGQILPQEVRVVRRTFKVPASFDHYKLEIAELKMR